MLYIVFVLFILIVKVIVEFQDKANLNNAPSPVLTPILTNLCK